MDTVTAADDVTEAIAHIEMHRQGSAQEAGLATACNEALRKLHELLGREQEAAQRHGPGTRHPVNVDAIVTEIARVKKLMGTPTHSSLSKAPQPGKHPVSMHSATQSPARNKGRRTMGRRGDS
jgi:hypothetical protein